MGAPPGNQYAKGHGKGRDTDYKDCYVKELYDYVKDCAKKKKFELPTAEGFAVRKKKAKSTIYKWADEHKVFSDALGFLKSSQCVELINGGLTNKLNSTITKLMLSSNHGMREKADLDVTTGGEKITGINYIVPKKK